MVRLAGFVLAIGCFVAFACALASSAGAKPVKSASKSAKKRARRHDVSTAAHITNPRDAADTPAVHYGQLSQDDCEAELTSRQIGFVRETATAVMAPVRLTGPLHGVVFRTDGKDAVRATSPYEIADCRLVLALDDFAQILESHDIVEVRHYSMYRPPRHWSEDKIGAQHDGALALDAGRFIDREGKVLDVDHDFHGAIGAKTCGDGAAPRPATPDALTLRAILCEAVDRRLFNVVLTPNYNRPHHNHFHLEVTAGVGWFLVH
ncbi:MAG TPA: hypothetical protein VFK02_35790 [Kofleriaceae bacterium]|nr:hypothetical protein [Kofleriaceae bacterium]